MIHKRFYYTKFKPLRGTQYIKKIATSQLTMVYVGARDRYRANLEHVVKN